MSFPKDSIDYGWYGHHFHKRVHGYIGNIPAVFIVAGRDEKDNTSWIQRSGHALNGETIHAHRDCSLYYDTELWAGGMTIRERG